MTNKELEARVLALEHKVSELENANKNVANGDHPNPNGPWWKTGAGRFANDPVFDEIVRLGREYRESLHPDAKKKKQKKKNDRS
jgi:hypothetical protein